MSESQPESLPIPRTVPPTERLRPQLHPAVRAFLFLAAGIVAGLIAFAAIDRFGSSFALPTDVEPIAAMGLRSGEQDQILGAAMARRNYQNTALTVAILGGVTGAILGLVAGIGRGTAAKSLLGSTLGFVLGAAGGAAGGLADVYTVQRLEQNDGIAPAIKTVAAHSAAFLGAGLGVGLGIGLIGRRILPSTAMGSAAGVVAACLFSVIVAALFPVTNTDMAVPPRIGPLLFWSLLPAAVIGLGLGRLRTATVDVPRT